MRQMDEAKESWPSESITTDTRQKKKKFDVYIFMNFIWKFLIVKRKRGSLLWILCKNFGPVLDIVFFFFLL